ncbi:MAG: TetR/AcrR family transcriptional regulator [Candidatus Acidiferrum sp.]
MSRNSPPPSPKTARGAAPQSSNWPAAKKKVPFSSVKKKIDRRVRATRDNLGDALIALMHEKPFETITVQHVLDRAKVSRSTFYSHYSDKNDLFLSDVEDFWEMMSTALIRRGDASNRVAPVQELFSHVADMRQFIASMTASQKVRDVMELGQGHFARAIEQRLSTLPATRTLSPTRRSALAHASAGSLFSLLNWWLAHGNAATPAQMDALFHQTLWSGINPARKPAPSTPNRPTARKSL